MSKQRWTPGPWQAFNMIHAKTGERMTPDEVGEYVANAMRQRPECDDFLFVSAEKADGEYDVCHVGNGADGPFNAALIAAAPDLYEALAAFERAKDLWLPREVAEEHAGEAEALHGLRRKVLDALAKARGEK